MAKSLKIMLLTVALIIFVATAWIAGIIPKQIGKTFACNYVEANYSIMNLKFERMEFSTAHGGYFAIFTNSESEPFNFLMTTKYLPIKILFDPIKTLQQ